MTNPIAVNDDTRQVVEIIREKSPSNELNMVLQRSSSSSKKATAATVHQEEKKEDERGTLKTTASYVEEEGQEALWIDVNVGGKDSASAAANKRSIFKRTTPSTTAAAAAAATPKNMHVLLLDPQATPPPPPPPVLPKQTSRASSKQDTTGTSNNKQRQAAEKADTARNLLAQALSADANVGSRQLLAESAFREALQARMLIVGVDIPKQQQQQMAALENAASQGQVAAATARQLQLQQQQQQQPGGVAAVVTQEEDADSAPKGTPEEHAAKALQCLAFVLQGTGDASIPMATRGIKGEPMDDMSTLGFDNTYIGMSPANNNNNNNNKGGRDSLDILSMSSLNEILDGPMEVSPENKPKEQVIARSTMPKEPEPEKKKRSGLFGGLFKKSSKKDLITVQDKPSESFKVTGINKTGNKKRASSAKKETKRETDINRFMATVMVENEDAHDMEREISNVDELKKYQDVDEAMERQLMEALSNDDTESITSFEGIRMHGKQAKPKKKGEKTASEAPEKPANSPTRKYGDGKPKFVSVPTGTPAILMQKSWDSLMENEAVPLIEEDVPGPTNPPGPSMDAARSMPEPAMEDADGQVVRAPSISPVSTAVASKDKYAVAAEPGTQDPPEADRYAVVSNDCDSFDAFFNSCSPGGGLEMVRGESNALPMPPAETAVLAAAAVAVAAPAISNESSDQPASLARSSSKTSSKGETKELKNEATAKKSTLRPRGLVKLFSKRGNKADSKSPLKEKSASKADSKSLAKEKSAPKVDSKSPMKETSAPKSAPGASEADVATARSVVPVVAIAPVSAQKTKRTSKSPVRAEKVAPLTSVGSNQKQKGRKLGLFGKKNDKESAADLKRESSAIRPVNISVMTTDSPTDSQSVSAASFAPGALQSLDENDVDPLIAQIKQQQNLHQRKAIDPITKDEPQAVRGIDP